MAKPTKKEKEEAYLTELQNTMLSAYSKALPEEYSAPTILLSQSILKSMAQYERFAKQNGLTYNSLLVLMCLYYTEDSTSQHTISKLLCLPKQTVGSVLNGFKKKGYVTESPDAHDARSKVLILNENGKSFAGPIFLKLQALDQKAIQAISPEGLNATITSMDSYTKAFELALEEVSD